LKAAERPWHAGSVPVSPTQTSGDWLIAPGQLRRLSWVVRFPIRFYSGSLATLMLLTACDKPTPSAPSIPATNEPPASVAPTRPQFTRLLGDWVRPDGGYVLSFRAVDAQGKLEATYANPGPVKVERAQAIVEDGLTRVFVVLRDVNYPGCTYTLTHDVKADQLFGQYFQATQQQTYEITFFRQPTTPP
jgi:hypothetical protein